MTKKDKLMKPVSVTLDSVSLKALEKLTKLSGLNVSEVVRYLIPSPLQVDAAYEWIKYWDKEAEDKEVVNLFSLAYAYQAFRLMIEDCVHPIGLQANFVSNKPQSARLVLILFLQFVRAKKKVKGYRFQKVKLNLPGSLRIWIVLGPEDTQETIRFWKRHLGKYLLDDMLVTERDQTELNKALAEARSRRAKK